MHVYIFSWKFDMCLYVYVYKIFIYKTLMSLKDTRVMEGFQMCT